MSEPKAGDVIRWARDDNWRGVEVVEFELEIYRFTLGFFESEDHRVSGRFTPLCDSDLWIDGPDTEERYMPHMGPYSSNLVPAFDIIKR